MMQKLILLTANAMLFSATCYCQNNGTDSLPAPEAAANAANHYTLHAKVEVPLVVAGAAFTLYNFSRISKKDASNQAYVEGLKKSDVNWFDRWGVRAYSEKKDNASYIPFFVAMPSPLLLFALDKKMRKDFFKLTFIYTEAMIITGVLYTSGAAYTNRLRPMVYSAETPMEKRLSSEQKKSFFAGHVALVATSTFLMARVIAEYHPASKFKWLYYSLAGVATAGTAYLRQAAGEHFPSDILLGAAVGTLSGLLTPSLHKYKLVKNDKLSIFPFSGNSSGLAVLYRL